MIEIFLVTLNLCASYVLVKLMDRDVGEPLKIPWYLA